MWGAVCASVWDANRDFHRSQRRGSAPAGGGGCGPQHATEAFTKRRLKRGVFRSLADLQATINRIVAEHNRAPIPFQWRADPDTIIAARNRGFQVEPGVTAGLGRPGWRELGGEDRNPPSWSKSTIGAPWLWPEVARSRLARWLSPSHHPRQKTFGPGGARPQPRPPGSAPPPRHRARPSRAEGFLP